MGPIDPGVFDRLASPLLGETVRLVPLTLKHIQALHRAFRDADLWRWQGRQPEDAAETANWVESALREAREHREAPFLIETIQGQLAGTTRYMDLRWHDAGVEIGWTIVFAPFQRSRVNTETKFLLLSRAFEELGCARVQLKTDAKNARSRAAIQRLGASYEGILRSHKRRADGSLRDTAFFSITSSEWPGVKSRLRGILES